MVRIVILGCAGSGKTSLARQLVERMGAPVISLDAVWQPHWEEKDVPAFRTFMKKAPRVMSGSATATLHWQPSISDYLGLLL